MPSSMQKVHAALDRTLWKDGKVVLAYPEEQQGRREQQVRIWLLLCVEHVSRR